MSESEESDDDCQFISPKARKIIESDEDETHVTSSARRVSAQRVKRSYSKSEELPKLAGSRRNRNSAGSSCNYQFIYPLLQLTVIELHKSKKHHTSFASSVRRITTRKSDTELYED